MNIKSEYEHLSREELVDIIEGYRNGSKAKTYEVGTKKLVEIANDFMAKTIDISSDEQDKTFSNFLNFLKLSKQIQENLDELQKSIDPTIVARIKKEASQLNEFSPEGVAEQIKRMNEQK